METNSVFHIYNFFYRFKSYYVVWKQKTKSVKLQSPDFGLNRTMQYGNNVELQKRGIIKAV